jgi:hypothetical protein
MPVEFSTPTDTEVRVSDARQHRQFVLESADPVALGHTSIEPFASGDDTAERIIDFAVEESRVFETSGLTIPERVNVHIREPDGSVLAQVNQLDARSFPEGTYVLELNTPVKLFVRFTSGFDIVSGDTESRVLLEEGTTVYLGARSMSDEPTEEFTVDGSLPGLYDLLTYVGGSLVTYSPERSWPTLRGHPPLVELGAESTVPSRSPDSGVTLRVPRDREFLYTVAPLAYYLDAAVVPDADAALETTAGFRDSLPSDDAMAFSRAVNDRLRHQFTLDALTRGVGFYDIDLFELEQFEREYRSLDWERLYGLSLAERVAAYQDVPRSATEAVQPQWRTAATIEGAPDNVTALPHLISELALVQPLRAVGTEPPDDDVVTEINTFLRAVRGPGDTPKAFERERYVSPPETGAQEAVWIGHGVPVKASKYLQAGYDADRDRSAVDSDISIRVVCNDHEMRHEVENELYGGRDDLPFEVSTSFDTSVAELRDLLGEETDFFHYIGHLDGEYFYCRDGRLDPETLTDIGVRGFLLNGCESYEQGIDLVEAGATGGIVTLSRVADRNASSIGVMLARLLDQGFSIRGALSIAREQQLVGSQYVGVGNTSIALVQSESETPVVAHIQSAPNDKYTVAVGTHPTNPYGIGTVYMPYLGRLERFFLSGGVKQPALATREEILDFVQQNTLMAIIFDGDFLWGPDFVERLS